MTVAEMKERRRAALTEAKAIAADAEKAGRGFTPEESEKITGLVEEATDLKGKIASEESLAAALADLAGLDGDVPPADPFSGWSKPAKTMGAQFVESAAYKGLLERYPDGHIPEKARIDTDAVPIKALITGGSSTSAGALVAPDWQGLVDVLGRPLIRVRDLVSKRTTSSDLVEFTVQTGRSAVAGGPPVVGNVTGVAAPVAEATAVTGATGTKPEGGFALAIRTAPVQTIAEWIPVTRRALSDAGQVRGLIDDELRGDILDAEELQLLDGTGASPQLMGILRTPGIQTQAWDENIAVTARKAITKCRKGGFAEPSAVLISSEDAETLDLMRDETGRFLGNGPFGTGPNTLWGKPTAISDRLPSGVGIVADFARAVIWDREQATITMSDSHQDFFVRNLVAILGEQREAFGVVRPSAFVQFATVSGAALEEPPPADSGDGGDEENGNGATRSSRRRSNGGDEEAAS